MRKDLLKKTMNLIPHCQLPLGINGSLAFLILFMIVLSASPALGQGFLYVANFASNDISGYSIDNTTGALTPVPGSPFPAAGSPIAVAVDSLGQFAYVANGTNSVSAYAIDATTGRLTPVPGSPFPAGSTPSAITVDPSNQFVYVTNVNANSLSAYTIDTSSGALSPVPGSPFSTGSQPMAVAVDPSAGFVYVANQGSKDISGYAIATTGGVVPLRGSPFAAGGAPRSLALDPGGQFLYVANVGSSSISAFTIGEKNSLTAIPGSPFTLARGAYSVSIDPSGQFIYAAGGPNVPSSTTTMVIRRTGAFTTVCGSPTTATQALGATSVAVHPSGQFVYVTNTNSNSITAYAMNATNGVLVPVPGSPFPTGHAPVAAAATGTASPLFTLQAVDKLTPITAKRPAVCQNALPSRGSDSVRNP